MEIAMLSVKRLPGVFGVEISGLDLSRPLDGDALARRGARGPSKSM
jgi:hypothetical protein